MIDDLRDKIRKLDEEIIKLMIERVETAEEIGRLKNELGLLIRDREVEKRVIERYRELTKGTSLDSASAEAICKVLIQNSVEAQAALPKVSAKKKKVCVIGGKGKMGVWITKLLRGSGHTVDAVDVGDDIGAAKNYDVVIISVPLSSVGDILLSLDKICKDQLIFDISSLKSPFINIIKEMGSRKKVCSIHPMFGPSAPSMYDRNVIVCDCGSKTAVKEVKEILGGHGENFKDMHISDHDRYMSYVLGLSHAVNIAFFTVLERSGISFDDFESVASTTFEKNIDTNLSVASEDSLLYYEIQHLNSNSSSVWDEFSDAVEDVRDASMDNNPEKFDMIMKKGKRFFNE